MIRVRRLPALGLLLLAPALAPAAPLPKSGTYEVAFSRVPSSEQVIALVKIEAKDDGSLAASVVATPEAPAGRAAPPVTVGAATVDGDLLRLAVKYGASDLAFEGRLKAGADTLRGSFGDDRQLLAGRLTLTDKTELKQADAFRRVDVPE